MTVLLQQLRPRQPHRVRPIVRLQLYLQQRTGHPQPEHALGQQLIGDSQFFTAECSGQHHLRWTLGRSVDLHVDGNAGHQIDACRYDLQGNQIAGLDVQHDNIEWYIFDYMGILDAISTRYLHSAGDDALAPSYWPHWTLLRRRRRCGSRRRSSRTTMVCAGSCGLMVDCLINSTDDASDNLYWMWILMTNRHNRDYCQSNNVLIKCKYLLNRNRSEEKIM